MSVPEVQYAKSGDVNIAYQVTGDGPFDLVFVPGYVTHLELHAGIPSFAPFLERLSSFCRLTRFDKRGTGMSDRVSGAPTLETRMDDVRAVMDAVGSHRAAFYGLSRRQLPCVLGHELLDQFRLHVGKRVHHVWIELRPGAADELADRLLAG